MHLFVNAYKWPACLVVFVSYSIYDLPNSNRISFFYVLILIRTVEHRVRNNNFAEISVPRKPNSSKTNIVQPFR